MDIFEAIERGHEDDISRLLDADPNSLETQSHVNGQEDVYRPLQWAALNGRLETVRLLVQRGANIHATGYLGRTALYYAAVNGHEEIVSLLLSQGARDDIADQDGRTPLAIAASGGHLGVVKILLQHTGGQGLEETDTGGRTALYYASENGHEEMVGYLLSQGARADITDSVGRSPFTWAAFMGHMGVAKMLVQHMEGQGLNETDKDGLTALHWAAIEGQEEMVSYLLSQGAQADITDQEGITPFMEAAWKGHVGVAKMLLQHMGAEGLDETGKDGLTALHMAAIEGHEDIMAFLLSQGAQADTSDQEGITPFMDAAFGGNLSVVKMILQHMGGKGLDETDNEGWTAVYHAATEGHEEMVGYLLRKGAQAGITDSVGRSPFTWAAMRGHLGVVKMLLQHTGGKGLNQTDDKGVTALHWAGFKGHEEIVTFLLSQGARADIADQNGMTPYMDAACKGHVGVVKMILQHMGGKGLDETDIEGLTALHWAAESGQEEMVGYLLSQGAQADIADQKGSTPLMDAACKGHVGVATVLLEHTEGQGLDQTDKNGWTALQWAAQKGHEKMVRALLLAGADATITDHWGRTPWAIADVMRRQECVEVFKVSI
jgi:serine/threonine-protein phosphatase 6 regulatory ankyrin repeat subunit B